MVAELGILTACFCLIWFEIYHLSRHLSRMRKEKVTKRQLTSYKSAAPKKDKCKQCEVGL
jgi:hypothetical protein